MKRVLALLVVLTLSACSPAEPDRPEPPSPFAACPESAGTGTGELAGVSLPCFTGGEPVSLAGLGRPAVINVWASWCPPCREELPEVQRFADAAAGEVIVLGVISGDTRTAAASVGVDYEISFPAVFDPDRVVAAHLSRAAIPITIFIDATGEVRHVEQVAGILTEVDLRRLTHEHLGLELP